MIAMKGCVALALLFAFCQDVIGESDVNKCPDPPLPSGCSGVATKVLLEGKPYAQLTLVGSTDCDGWFVFLSKTSMTTDPSSCSYSAIIADGDKSYGYVYQDECELQDELVKSGTSLEAAFTHGDPGKKVYFTSNNGCPRFDVEVGAKCPTLPSGCSMGDATKQKFLGTPIALLRLNGPTGCSDWSVNVWKTSMTTDPSNCYYVADISKENTDKSFRYIFQDECELQDELVKSGVALEAAAFTHGDPGRKLHFISTNGCPTFDVDVGSNGCKADAQIWYNGSHPDLPQKPHAKLNLKGPSGCHGWKMYVLSGYDIKGDCYYPATLTKPPGKQTTYAYPDGCQLQKALYGGGSLGTSDFRKQFSFTSLVDDTPLIDVQVESVHTLGTSCPVPTFPSGCTANVEIWYNGYQQDPTGKPHAKLSLEGPPGCSNWEISIQKPFNKPTYPVTCSYVSGFTERGRQTTFVTVFKDECQLRGALYGGGSLVVTDFAKQFHFITTDDCANIDVEVKTVRVVGGKCTAPALPSGCKADAKKASYEGKPALELSFDGPTGCFGWRMHIWKTVVGETSPTKCSYSTRLTPSNYVMPYQYEDQCQVDKVLDGEADLDSIIAEQFRFENGFGCPGIDVEVERCPVPALPSGCKAYAKKASYDGGTALELSFKGAPGCSGRKMYIWETVSERPDPKRCIYSTHLTPSNYVMPYQCEDECQVDEVLKGTAGLGPNIGKQFNFTSNFGCPTIDVDVEKVVTCPDTTLPSGCIVTVIEHEKSRLEVTVRNIKTGFCGWEVYIQSAETSSSGKCSYDVDLIIKGKKTVYRYNDQCDLETASSKRTAKGEVNVPSLKQFRFKSLDGCNDVIIPVAPPKTPKRPKSPKSPKGCATLGFLGAFPKECEANAFVNYNKGTKSDVRLILFGGCYDWKFTISFHDVRSGTCTYTGILLKTRNPERWSYKFKDKCQLRTALNRNYLSKPAFRKKFHFKSRIVGCPGITFDVKKVAAVRGAG